MSPGRLPTKSLVGVSEGPGVASRSVAAGLSDEAGVAAVGRQARRHLLPKMLKGGRAPGEMDAGEPRIVEHRVSDLCRRARHHVDDALGEAGLFEQLHTSIPS